MNIGTRLVYGLGINDADYSVRLQEEVPMVEGKKRQRITWRCPYYSRWASMFMRCYSIAYQDKYPTYRGCSVSDEWLLFSNFKKWMEQQDWEGKQLDKDLLVEGNKVYSPDTCVFVEERINYFILTGIDGNYLQGVSKNPRRRCYYRSRCRNPFTSKEELLGVFDNELDAHLAWKAKKLEHVYTFIEKGMVTDDRIKDALINRYS